MAPYTFWVRLLFAPRISVGWFAESPVRRVTHAGAIEGRDMAADSRVLLRASVRLLCCSEKSEQLPS
jgi:hypothetical protein